MKQDVTIQGVDFLSCFVNNILMCYFKMLQEVKIPPVKVESVENGKILI